MMLMMLVLIMRSVLQVVPRGRSQRVRRLEHVQKHTEERHLG